MEYLQLMLYILIFILMAVVNVYNFTYPNQVDKSGRELSVKPPKILKILFLSNKLLSLFTLLLIFLLIIWTALFTS